MGTVDFFDPKVNQGGDIDSKVKEFCKKIMEGNQ